ncbi:acid phosphatase [Bradyrhizobium sp.]|uniref:acid phosphatase n=1 Tax=Bradyrhizobium sp. TaxID=376 RepID=UPI001D613B34|nr:acid phosphatase [Bradyrhizobium sp.]MBI5318550.1 acid phosphatase [Bradyrhizobium sp.]
MRADRGWKSILRIDTGLAAAALALAGGGAGHAADLSKIANIVVIYAENRSFDHLYGLFPGANGIANAKPEQSVQRDHDGSELPSLRVWNSKGEPEPGYPPLPNAPFRIDAPPVSKLATDVLLSPIHAYYHNIEQINGGKNDMFAAMSTVGGYTMGYFDGSGMKLWQWAKEYTLADNFFMGAFGGSYLNHQYLICACAPAYKDAPESMRAVLDDKGRLKKKPDSPSARDGAVKTYSGGIGGQVTPDGYTVNTTQPAYQPSGVPPAEGGPLEMADPKGNERIGLPLPPSAMKTIGDTLSAKSIGWVWYSGGWNEALKDGMRPPADKRKVIYTRADGAINFQPHHQPFNYYARFAPGTADRAAHLKDGADFLAAIEGGTLPQVSFYKPVGLLNQHPSYTDLMTGDAHIADILERLRKSPQWGNMLVIVTYDENGGFWDHVAPPSGPGWSDRWGPATRIPAIVVSPFAKRGHVDHTAYDTGSILKLITARFALEPLPGVREKAGDLTAALDLP